MEEQRKDLPSLYQNFIHLSRYSRWMDDSNKRETWNETVSRYFDFFVEHLKENHNHNVSDKEREELEEEGIDLVSIPWVSKDN